MTMISQTTSADGTQITFDRIGRGPSIVLVDGAFCTRAFGPNRKLAAALAESFTVYTYDRRGRGDSGSSPPHDLRCEIDDLAAVIDEAGGRAALYGISSGGGLALEAARRLPGVNTVAVYEVPFIVDDTRAPLGPDFLPRVREALAAERRSEAVHMFMTEGIAQPVWMARMMRLMPAWSRLKRIAHTVPQDLSIVDGHQRGRPLDPAEWADVNVPALVVAGAKSPAWIRNAMEQLAGVLPNAEHQLLAGQTHMVKPGVLAPVLTEYFGDASRRAGDRPTPMESVPCD